MAINGYMHRHNTTPTLILGYWVDPGCVKMSDKDFEVWPWLLKYYRKKSHFVEKVWPANLAFLFMFWLLTGTFISFFVLLLCFNLFGAVKCCNSFCNVNLSNILNILQNVWLIIRVSRKRHSKVENTISFLLCKLTLVLSLSCPCGDSFKWTVHQLCRFFYNNLYNLCQWIVLQLSILIIFNGTWSILIQWIRVMMSGDNLT